MRLLLIDDDEDDRFIFKEMLKDVAPAIDCVAGVNGEDGLRLLASLDPLPDYIFLDINMPGLNGFDCLKKIKENAKWKHIPVIIHSTSKSDWDVQQAHKLGANYYLLKPGNFANLRNALCAIFKLEHQADASSRIPNFCFGCMWDFSKTAL